LTILAPEVGNERWPKLAARWQSRLVSETPGIGAAESGSCSRRPARWADHFGELAARTLRQLVHRRAETL
jgi:hypothetical protein